MDKEQATRMLGFRDAKGALVDLAAVLDLSKTYRVCLAAENGSWKPSPEEIGRISSILKELGVKGGVFAETGTGGVPFFNKGGIVICRFTESRVDAPPPPKRERAVMVEEIPDPLPPPPSPPKKEKEEDSPSPFTTPKRRKKSS